MSDEEALLTAHTAVLIGGDAAIPLLGRYQDHPDPQVRQLLCSAWHRFDTVSYAEGVLADLPEDDVHFEITTPEELSVFSRMGSRSRIRVSKGFDTIRLVQALRPDRVTHLWLPAEQSVTWYWLAAFSRLDTLTLDPSTEAVDISSLAAHPLLRLLRIPSNQPIVGKESLIDKVVVESYQPDPGIDPAV
ncbi:hypothetical protein [Streptomyces sp. R35]|uniref:Uncharacterized protein n=1 Tax=Streptomyces sp. R35 TaxID=3238630 RepID=A0AB39SHA1_9ACTN